MLIHFSRTQNGSIREHFFSGKNKINEKKKHVMKSIKKKNYKLKFISFQFSTKFNSKNENIYEPIENVFFL